jgi:5-formyltetrahydrofolate cyclo-ligase
MTDLELAKKSLREEVLKKRSAVHSMSRERAANTIRDLFLQALPLRPGSIVAGYWPLPGEVDSTPLLNALAEKKFEICLPVVTEHESPLIFRKWTVGMNLGEGYAGTRIPPAESPILNPDILVVPLVAFDRAGYRLGYGGGFYDRTLNAMRAQRQIMAVGLAYAAQQVPLVPHEGTDEKLDWVVTEELAIGCN